VALENIVRQLEDQKARLQKELNAVVKMIRAAGKGVRASIEEYGRSSKRGSPRMGITKARRTRSASVRKRMAAAQKARWARVEASEANNIASVKKATKSQVKTATRQAK
jgi:hypothetical protein